MQRIGNDYLEYVKDCENPKAAWSSLCGAFERKGVANRMYLRRKLLTLKMKEGGDLGKHILEFEKIVRKLKSAGAKIEEEDNICQLLISLPHAFEPVSTALEIMKPEELNMEFVKARLQDFDIKRRSNIVTKAEEIETYQNSAAMVGCIKKPLKCFACGKTGHYQNECPVNASRRSRKTCSNCEHYSNRREGHIAQAESSTDYDENHRDIKDDYVL